jgi:putative membrane protein
MPTWHRHAEVWVLVAALVVGYRYAVTRLAPFGEPVPRRQQWAFLGGVLALWVGAEWPIHDLAEGYLLSVHMTQHLLFTFVAPPLFLIGTPGWLLRRALGPHLLAVVRRWAHPLLAGLVFNAVIVFSHWPVVVDATLRHEPLHFAVHVLLFTTASVMWLPVFSPLPEIRRLSDPGRMVYLFLQSVVPTVPASFLTFADEPLYKFYAHVPRIWGISAVEDQQLAGAIMKLAGGAILWGTIFVIFFRWYQRQDREDKARRAAERAQRAGEAVLTWDEVERELTRTEADAPREA